MKRVKIYVPGNAPLEFSKGERAQKPIDDFVQEIKLEHNGDTVVIFFSGSNSQAFHGMPYEFYELNESKDTFQLK